MPHRASHPDIAPAAIRPRCVLRMLPLAAVLVLVGLAYAMGWHRDLSLETLLRHRAAIDGFIASHYATSLAIFVGVYIATVALSIPAALFLSISSGILFGSWIGPVASVLGATIGGSLIFMVAQTAFGEHLVRRAGPAIGKLADGFRADAFSYLLFLRLTPIFPFWLVNLAPALFGVRLRTFVLATVLGVLPAAIAFSIVGAGLDSVIAAQETAFRDCLTAGRADCHLNFDLRDAITPELLTAFCALGLIALIPVLTRRWCARWRSNRVSGANGRG